MNWLRKIKEKFLHFFLRKKFPERLEKIWFAYKAVCPNKCGWLADYDRDGKWIDYKVGDVVPMIKKEINRRTYIAYYRIVGWKKSNGDLALWDDGREYDLELVKIREEEK